MTRKDKFRQSGKKKTVMLSLALLIIVSVGITFAYLISQTNPVVNTFSPSVVDVEIIEEFDGEVKKNVNVENTKNTAAIEAYIRVKLISYRVNDQGEKIGGKAEVPNFEPEDNWVEHNGFYYYTQPVAPGESPENPLIGESGIKLQAYNDADGGKQVIEVMAEGIQSEPVHAHEEAWGVKISSGNVTDIGGGE